MSNKIDQTNHQVQTIKASNPDLSWKDCIIIVTERIGVAEYRARLLNQRAEREQREATARARAEAAQAERVAQAQRMAKAERAAAWRAAFAAYTSGAALRTKLERQLYAELLAAETSSPDGMEYFAGAGVPAPASEAQQAAAGLPAEVAAFEAARFQALQQAVEAFADAVKAAGAALADAAEACWDEDRPIASPALASLANTAHVAVSAAYSAANTASGAEAAYAAQLIDELAALPQPVAASGERLEFFQDGDGQQAVELFVSAGGRKLRLYFEIVRPILTQTWQSQIVLISAYLLEGNIEIPLGEQGAKALKLTLGGYRSAPARRETLRGFQAWEVAS
jgi:hypothetical protein